MRKFISLLLVLAMLAVMTAGCSKGGADPAGSTGGTEGGSQKAPLTDALDAVIAKIYEEQPMEISLENVVLDLTDTSENNLWQIQSNSGLENAGEISQMAVSVPMIGSIAYTMTLVRVKDAANAQAVAQKMKDGIDPHKWVCVSADEVIAAGYGDVVMLVMTSFEQDVHAQQLTDAFQKVCGAELDFVI